MPAVATVTLNPTMQGVEVRFSAKPEQPVIDSLKASGFKWSARQKLWYNRDSQKAREAAQKIASADFCPLPEGSAPQLTQAQIDCPVKPGMMFETSWGYDQTNYDFVVVLEVSRTGKTCTCQRARTKEDVSKSSMCYHALVLCPEGYGETFQLKIQDYKGKPELRGSYLYCDGGKRLATLYPVEPGRAYHETDSMFGH